MPTHSMTDAAPRCYALVPCAGVGERAGAGGPKQYAQLAGRAVVAHTLAALDAVPRLDAPLVALARDDRGFEHAVPDWSGPRRWLARCGGATRAATVAAGLVELRQRGVRATDWVLVHDAARCLLRAQWVDRLIDACLSDEVGGLLALSLADTLKHPDAGRAARGLDRRDKWLAQAPPMFRCGELQAALAAAGDVVTDEASAIEATGRAPLLVAGDYENLKLTWPADFALAERLLRSAPGPHERGRATGAAGDAAAAVLHEAR